MPDVTKKSGTAKKQPNKPVAAAAPAKKTAATKPRPTAKAKAAAATTSRVKKTATQEEPTVRVHHTAEPSALKKNVVNGSKAVVKTVRQRRFWAWVGAVAAVIVLLLIVWWQWQRSYIAVVGGQFLPVTMMDDQLRANYGNSGVNSIIQQQLIMQEANRKHINITDKQISDQLAKIKTSSGGDKSYHEQLKQLGIAESLLRTQVEVQLMREALLKDKIQVNDQEINDYYEQNKATIDPEGKTGVAGLKDQINETLKQQKLDSATPDYVDSLKQRTNVDVHLDHLSLTFGQFLQETIVPIPGNIWNFITGKK